MEQSSEKGRWRQEQFCIQKSQYGKYCAYGLLLLVIVFFAAVRFRLRAMPLERDEGEYAYIGHLMLQGIPPYKLAYTMKLPGTGAAYAGIMAIFGQTSAGIHLGLLMVNAVTTLLIYLLAVRLSGRLAGVVAAASYALVSAGVAILGLAAHATHFVVLFALAGTMVLLKAMETERTWQFFMSGLLFGLAFLMKQPGIAFAAFGGSYLVAVEWKHPVAWKRLWLKVGSLGAGVLLPFGLTCLMLWAAGVFRTFWFWTFTYAREYASETAVSPGIRIFLGTFPAVMGPSAGVWMIAGFGVASLVWHRESRRHAFLIASLSLWSFVALTAGLAFRDHYFILVLPAVALLAGIAVQSTTEALAARSLAFAGVPVLLFAAACGYSVLKQAPFFLQMDPVTACEKRYGENPFPEALAAAQYVEAHTSASDRIAVFGSEPEIYFYARRHSATGFIYVYGLVEQQKYAFEMQKQMISEIESVHPRFVVAVQDRLSWLANTGSPELLSFSTWADHYLSEQYELAGLVERVGERTECRWDNEIKNYQARSQNVIGVFRRRN